MNRILVPEILDSLAHDDPSARRSRRDLRRINALMGNFRWLRQSLSRIPKDTPLVEVGSGDGAFLKVLAADGWKNLAAIEITPRPDDLPDTIKWMRENMLTALPKVEGSVLVANLFWHHFSDEQLSELAPELTRFRHLLLSEPFRSPFASALGMTLLPFINHVTRHDMFVSIRAGFCKGELPELWELSKNGMQFSETKGLLGSYRMHAWRP